MIAFLKVQDIFDSIKAIACLVKLIHDDGLVLGKWEINDVFISSGVRMQLSSFNMISICPAIFLALLSRESALSHN